MTTPTKVPTILCRVCHQTHAFNLKTCPKWKLKTGLCLAGFHEGKKPKTYTGEPAQVCHQWMLCPCDCHDLMDKMFAMAEEERVWVENPEYVKPIVAFIMPELGVDYGVVQSSPPDLVSAPLDLEGLPQSLSAPALPIVGDRAPRGSLEQQVLAVCTVYARDGDDENYCTPQYVSDGVYAQTGYRPSTGAVNSVFMRWEKWDFAIVGRKPTRFQTFTPDGAKYGMEFMRNKFKRGGARL